MLSKQNPILAYGVTAVTGSSIGIKPGLTGRIAKVVPVHEGDGTAGTSNGVAKIDVVISTDRKTFSLYAWKVTSTSNPTLIAATAAVNIGWLAVSE